MGRLVASLGVIQGFRFTVFTIQKVRFSGFTSPNPTHGGRSRLRLKNSGLITCPRSPRERSMFPRSPGGLQDADQTPLKTII